MTDESAQLAEAIPTPPEPHPEDAGPAIDAAFAALEADEPEVEAAPEPEPEAENKPETEAKPDDSGPERNADGTFKAKEAENKPETPVEADSEPSEAEVEEPAPTEPETIKDAPPRFSADAKGEWSNAPASVRGEINRVMREMEGGLAEYQERWEPLKEFDALAKEHGTDIQTALKQYIAFEQGIRADPIAGLTQTCADLGLDFRAIVAEVSGQPADQIATRNDSNVTAMQQRIAGLEKQLGDVSTTMQTQREADTTRDVQAFAADHPRLDELAPDIAEMLNSGYAKTLPEAYEKADRLNPAPASTPAAQTSTPTPAAQTRAASLSVTGAPGSGSNPVVRKAPSSAGDAVDNAFSEIMG